MTTNTPDILAFAMTARQAQGLKIIVTGLDIPKDQPFTAYAKDTSQRDAWIAGQRAKGYTVEVAA